MGRVLSATLPSPPTLVDEEEESGRIGDVVVVVSTTALTTGVETVLEAFPTVERLADIIFIESLVVPVF